MERPAVARLTCSLMRNHRYHVYIVASRSHTFYIGVTSAIGRRMHEHKTGVHEGFSKLYNSNRLVYLETHDDVQRAIAREKQLKRWSRTKRITLIERQNPTWQDLSEGWGLLVGPTSGFVGTAGQTAGLSTAASPPVEMTEGADLHTGEGRRMREDDR